MAMSISTDVSSSDGGIDLRWWRSLWRLNILNKIKISFFMACKRATFQLMSRPSLLLQLIMSLDLCHLKMNTDSTFVLETDATGFGVVIRNASDMVLYFAADPLRGVSYALHAELLAIRRLKVILYCQYKPSINSAAQNRLEGAIIFYFVSLLPSAGGDICCYASRIKNVALHTLACFGIGSDVIIFGDWDNLPTCIRDCILEDNLNI
ncbi:hypothetical protein PanWU01x14_323570 [Parasponia andersonii]|uniref:RNase H type-1 domain-containing protein n=1 Tax=Parasponia andersonii TaxID=3476 RepID=A0A2P5AKD5_PARAD|nr:hypothetical protein PanWU01x14_323570 [Parasponia andersonii]